MSEKIRTVPKQGDLAFPDKGIQIGKPEEVDHSKKFGLKPEDFSCPQCEIGGNTCPKHQKK